MLHTNLVSIGGCIIKHCSEMSEKDLQLVFDYLFHKQCLNAHTVRCGRMDFTISPMEPENPKSMWNFESLNKDIDVAIDNVFDIEEMSRIAHKALFIATALKMREVTCNVQLKNAYI
ncbi:MAG: hypothetical protein AB7E96_11020 [Deferribacterales bacterium]